MPILKQTGTSSSNSHDSDSDHGCDVESLLLVISLAVLPQQLCKPVYRLSEMRKITYFTAVHSQKPVRH